MQTKKRTHGRYSIKQPEIFPEELADKVFPTRIPGCSRYFDLLLDDTCIATACVDIINTVCIIHLWIPIRYRSRENIREAAGIFKKVGVPLLEDLGVNVITTNCSVDDLKTKALMQTFGFSCEDITVGVYNTG